MSDAKWKSLYEEELSRGYVPPFTSDLEEEEEKPPTPVGPFGDFRDYYLEELGVVETKKATPIVEAEAPTPSWRSLYEEELSGSTQPRYEPEPQESILRSFADPFLNVAAGINDVVKGFADAFGADNAVSQNLAKNSEWYRSLLSAGAKQDQEEIGRIMQEAEGQGVLAEIGAGLKALSVAPIDLVSQGIGSLIPFIATAGVGKAVGLSKAGIAILQGVQGGAVGGGIVKGEIYSAVKEQLINSGVDEAKAEKAANEAQAYNGKNLDQIFLGVGLGVAASTTGADSAIRKLIAQKVGKKAAEEVSEQAVQEVLRTGFVRGAAKGAAVEFATEGLQGGQERLAANIAVGREGFDVDPMRGVVAQGTLEGSIGAILGGGVSGISARVAQRDAREVVALRDAAKAAQEAKQNNAPASAAAVENQIEQVGEALNIPATVGPLAIREGETQEEYQARIDALAAETPEQRVARLQEEATAAAGIELEEEGVGVEPTVPVTPPVEPAPEGAVAPVEPVVEPVVAEPPVIETKAENPVVETEQKSQEQTNTVKVFRGVAEAGNIPNGGAFFTDSEKDASAYAQLAALRKAVDENEQLSEIVGEIMTEEGAESITDLSISTVKNIIEGNKIEVGNISEGTVLRGNINLGNTLNLESFGSEVGSLPETWNQLNELGLVAETWQSLDEEVQAELQDKYRGKAFYSLLEQEVNLNDQFAKGVDTIVFTDQNTEGKGTHRTYLTKAAEQFSQEAAPTVTPPAEVTPTPETPNLEPLRRVARAEQTPERIFYHAGPSTLTVGAVAFDKGAMGFHAGAKTQAEWVAKDKTKGQVSEFYVKENSDDGELGTQKLDHDMSWEHADALLVELVSDGLIDKEDAINLANTWGDMSAKHKQALNNDLQKVRVGDGYAGMDGDVGEFMLQSSTNKNAQKLGQIRKLLVDNGVGALEYVNEVEGVGGDSRAVAVFDKKMLAPSAEAPKPTILPRESLPRLVRGEQTEEDVASLVERGFAEVYKGQPVITQAGLDIMPESMRPRLTPEARKIQIDTRANEVVAEAISKNLRIGVDQVGANVRMPAGWTLDGDIYVPPQKQEVAVEAPASFDLNDWVLANYPNEYSASKYLDPSAQYKFHLAVWEKAGRPEIDVEPSAAPAPEVRESRREPAPEDRVTIQFKGRPDPELGQRVSIKDREGRDIGNIFFKQRAYLSGSGYPLVNEFHIGFKRKYQRMGYFADAVKSLLRESPNPVFIVSSRVVNDNVFKAIDNLDRSVFDVKELDRGFLISLKPEAAQQEREARIQMPRSAGMETEAVATKLESLGFGRGGIVSVVNEPDASFEGRTIIRDGKVVGIELNAAALKDDAAIERVLNHEIAESANADGALNTLVAGLTPKERKEINDAITRLGYSERARTAEEAARAVELLAEGWRGRKWFDRAVARIEAWANKLGYKLTRRAAEYIAARNVSEINAEFKQAYNKFINVQGEAREGRAFVTPAENARFLELAQNPEANREELQKMVNAAAKKAGYNVGLVYHGSRAGFTSFSPQYLGNDIGFHFGTAEQADFRVGDDGAVRGFHIQIKNPLRLEDQGGWYGYDVVQMVNTAIGSKLNPSASTSAIRRAIQDAGYDGVVYQNKFEGVGDSYVAFSPPQIKSADPVTRDDEGNIIPIDQRFQPTEADIRYSIRESRREDAIPTFSEGSPEAATLSTMAASMAKVDGASEGKPNPENKPTYKISEIASVWMDQGGDVRQLQDLISENTNLTPTNAAKVANAIAKQYDIQQSIATAFLETQTGLSVEALPEGVTLPKEVDPDRPRPVMQRLFDVFMGVRVPPVKITVNEKTALKQQIRLKAAANRAAKQEQQRTADEVVEVIKAMELRGPVRPKQVQALAKRAAKVIWTSEKSMESFVEYAAKVVENANYDADLREAKAAQKRAKELSKQKKAFASPQRDILSQIGKVAVNKLDDPRIFADTVNYYLRGFKDVRSPEYVVVPDTEMTGYLSQLETEAVVDQAEVERESNERLAEKYGLDPNTIPELMNLINIIEEIEGQENREALESVLTDKAIETQEGLRGYDTTPLNNTQKGLVEAMLNVDIKAINSQERQKFIRVANNMIYNNQTNGADYFVATAKGQQNARKAAQDSKLIQRNKAWIPLIPAFGSLKLEKTLRNFSLELQSVADTFRNVFGKDFMAKAYEMMGMLDLNEGFAKANNTIDEIQELMAEFHQGNDKKYGDAARSQDGILSEGVAGFLIQSFPFKDEATSIAQRRSLINEYITNARNSREIDRVSMADRVEAILNKVDGVSVQEILNNMKKEYRPNYDSLMWYKDVLFPKYKDFLKQFDENFNDQANNYDNPNYLPISFTSAGPALAIGPEDVSISNAISLQPKQSVYTMKRLDYTTLPKDRDGNPKDIEFNLRRAAFNSLSDQINKAYTSSAWQQLFSFMKTPESVEFFGDRANRDFFVDRLNRLRASRARRGSVSGGAVEQVFDSFSIISRKLGTGIALGGFYQWIKQPPDQLITALGSGGRSDLLAKNIAPWTQKQARPLLNLFSVGRRGDSSAGYKYINQMEGHQSRMERYFTESKFDQAKEQAGKIADVWMIALKKSDFIAASAAWMTYYEGELNKNNIKIDDWAKEAELVKTDPVRRQAAAFAENMTDIYQGSSDPTSMATFAQSGKTGWENFTKALLVPFNSFAVQQRMRLYSDARDALTGNKGGIGGLSGTIGGLILFHATKRFVIPVASGVGISVLYGLMGVDMDEPDEEKQKEMADRNWRQFLADITGNLLVGGTPQIVESGVIKTFNRASYLVGMQLESESVMDDNGEIMSFDKYSKERSPFYRYQSFDSAMSLGMFDIGFGQAKETALQTKMLMDRDEMDMYTPEEQRLLYFSALSEWLYLMRLNDTDFARLVKKARRDMIKSAEEREKELARIRSGR